MALEPTVELDVMHGLAAELKKLGGETPPTQRVLHWAVSAFLPDFRLVPAASALPENTTIRPGAAKMTAMHPLATGGTNKTWDSLPELFSVVSPTSDAERALIVAYWMQKEKGEADFDSFTINKELKHLGYAASNITSALTQLIVRKPQLAIQTHKSGSSQQARKRYRLTNEGLRSVERMLDEGSANG